MKVKEKNFMKFGWFKIFFGKYLKENPFNIIIMLALRIYFCDS